MTGRKEGGLQAGRPPQEPQQGGAVAEGELQEVSRGDLLRVQETAGGVARPVGLHAPPQERGAPRRKPVRPGQAQGDEHHAQPHGESPITTSQR